jgi:hypothetical protein
MPILRKRSQRSFRSVSGGRQARHAVGKGSGEEEGNPSSVEDLVAKGQEVLSKPSQLMQAGTEAEAFMRGAWMMAEQSAINELKDRFAEIIEVDKQPFIDAVAPLVQEEAERLGIVDEVSYILEMGQNY